MWATERNLTKPVVRQSKSMLIVCMRVGECLEADLQVREVLRGNESKQGSFIFLPVQPGRVRSDTVPHLFSCSTSPPSFRPSSLIIISLTSVPHHTYPSARTTRQPSVSHFRGTSVVAQPVHELSFLGPAMSAVRCLHSIPQHLQQNTHFFGGGWGGGLGAGECSDILYGWQPVCHRHVTHSHAGGYTTTSSSLTT